MRMMLLRGRDAMGDSSGLAVLPGGPRRCASSIKRLKTAGIWKYRIALVLERAWKDHVR